MRYLIYLVMVWQCFADSLQYLYGQTDSTAPSHLRLSVDDDATQKKVLSLMDRYYVPGMSLAAVDNEKIAWARGYGVTTPGGSSVSKDTRFQVGSVSKSVAAAVALRLVELGKLSLDADLNDALVSWKIPERGINKE